MSLFHDLVDARRRLSQIYNPKTAFTDPEVHELTHIITVLSEELEGKEECRECKGTGEAEDDEGFEGDCPVCEGSGAVAV